MAVTDLPAGLAEMLPAYLGRQRWYAGSGDPDGVEVLDHDELCTTGDGSHRLHWVLTRVGSDRYQLLVGERPAGEPAEFLNGHEAALIGTAGERYFYDGALDPELALKLLGVVTAGVGVADRVRPVGVEQSNTSLVYDERTIVKVFRRLTEGANRDVTVTNALARVGFAHVAAPVATWRRDGTDLAFAQTFLAGGTEGWALAQTSLRDFYNSGLEDPAEAGGDFALEAARLGRVTADLHLAMRDAWGAEPLAGGEWTGLLDSVDARLRAFLADAAAADPEAADGVGAARAALDALARVGDPGPAQPVHGDYHLGQVMRTDSGWYVLDFEGEPARPAAERLRPSSPLKDVTGMLRSIDYAARFAVGERGGADPGALARADAWERRNRDAYLEGYLGRPGVDDLLPPGPDRPAVLAAYELDKALYELEYERAYRPGWVSIPAGAIARILARLT